MNETSTPGHGGKVCEKQGWWSDRPNYIWREGAIWTCDPNEFLIRPNHCPACGIKLVPAPEPLPVPEDVAGECNAHLYIGDDFGDNYATMRCQLPLGHSGPHREEFREGKAKAQVEWIGRC